MEAKIVAVADIFPEAAKKRRRELRRAGGQVLQRVRRLPEGARRARRQLRHPGHAAGLPRRPFQGRRRGRQERVHGEAGGGGRPRLPGHVCGGGAGQAEGPEGRRRHPAPPPGRATSRPSSASRMAPLATSSPCAPIGSTAARSGIAGIRATPTSNGRFATGTITSGSAATISASSTSTTSTSATGS